MIARGVASPKMSRLLLPLIGLAGAGGVVLLYKLNNTLYFDVMNAVIKVPMVDIFADWEWIPSAIECWQRGVDVWHNNTCYYWPNLGFNYSPLWLRLTFLPYGHRAANTMATCLIVIFFLSLATLRPPRTRRELLVLVLTMLSSGTGLLIERANADLLMFLLVIAAANACLFSAPLRLLGYAMITLAGLLKFYPMTALVVALRERLGVAALVFVAAGCALVGLVAAFHDELVIMAHNLPFSSWWTLQFGEAELPTGLSILAVKLLARLHHDSFGSMVRTAGAIELVLSVVLTAFAIAAAFWWARNGRLVEAMSRVPERDAVFFVAGGVVLCGCFFAGQSVLYRGVFWLLALPALLSLSREEGSRRRRAAFSIGAWLVPFVMWMPFFEWVLDWLHLSRELHYADSQLNAPDPIGLLLWLCDKLAWWFLITVLMATGGSYLFGAVFSKSPHIARLRAGGQRGEIVTLQRDR